MVYIQTSYNVPHRKLHGHHCDLSAIVLYSTISALPLLADGTLVLVDFDCSIWRRRPRGERGQNYDDQPEVWYI